MRVVSNCSSRLVSINEMQAGQVAVRAVPHIDPGAAQVVYKLAGAQHIFIDGDTPPHAHQSFGQHDHVWQVVDAHIVLDTDRIIGK